MKRIIYILTCCVLVACGQTKTKDTAADVTDTTKAITTNAQHTDTVEFKESFNEEDKPVNEYMVGRLKLIRENFKRINSIAHWRLVDTIELQGSAEGGEGRFYYQGKKLEKLLTKYYGETFQTLTEYYLMSGQLSFVFEKTYRYNRPFYYDSVAMKESNDTETFTFDKSTIIEQRSYFEKGKLLHQLNNQNGGSPFTQEYLLEEEKRIYTDFESLIKLAKK